MKILIIGFAKIKYMPYLNLYLENADRDKNDVDLIYWNRDLTSEDISNLSNVTIHEFLCRQDDDVPKYKKIKSFLKFRKFAKSVLKRNFDFVVVLHSLPAVLLFDMLTAKYKDRFIFDYRDVTYEKSMIYKSVIHSLVKNSKKTFVSSDGFRKFLPQCDEKIITSHNVIQSEINGDFPEKNTSGEKVRLSFWGFIREEKTNLEIIKKIGNDSRFELHYYGREQATACNIKTFAEKGGYKNVFFHGEYAPSDRFSFAENTDIIHNVYAEDNMMFAVSNKYYDGLIFKKPQLVMKNSFMAEISEKSGVGFAVDPFSQDFANDVYGYFKNLDRNVFKKNCSTEILRISKEAEKTAQTVRDILCGE